MPRVASRRANALAPPSLGKTMPDWSQLLVEAVTKPGVVSSAYRLFWHFSTGNQLLAWFEALSRQIEPGPIHTFAGWLKLDRHVRKGEKAIGLVMPVTWKSKPDPARSIGPARDNDGDDDEFVRRAYVLRRRWFFLAQTDGADYVPTEIPAWSEAQACHTLMIDREPFRHADGNCQGYAVDRRFAVSPVAYAPERTMFHEIGHIVLGHCAEAMGLSDHGERTPKDVREVEAEAVSYVICQALGLTNHERESRGYLQHWLGERTIEARSAQRIFHAADRILRAGRPQAASAGDAGDPA